MFCDYCKEEFKDREKVFKLIVTIFKAKTGVLEDTFDDIRWYCRGCAGYLTKS